MQGNRVDWEIVKDFRDSETGLTVQVSKLPLRRPKFNLSIGVFRDGKLQRFISPSVHTENAVVKVAANGMKLARLVDEATLYVQEQLQVIEDEEILAKQLREHRAIQRETGANDTPKTGKTEREAAKRARHEHNLSERRSADQARTSSTKGRSK